MPINKRLQKEEGVRGRDNEKGGGEAKQSRHPYKLISLAEPKLCSNCCGHEMQWQSGPRFLAPLGGSRVARGWREGVPVWGCPSLCCWG